MTELAEHGRNIRIAGWVIVVISVLVSVFFDNEMLSLLLMFMAHNQFTAATMIDMREREHGHTEG